MDRAWLHRTRYDQIRDCTRQCRTGQDWIKPNRIAQGHNIPDRTAQENKGPFTTLKDHTGSYRPYRIVLDYKKLSVCEWVSKIHILGKSGLDYADKEDSTTKDLVPPASLYTFNCTTSFYTCPKGNFHQCRWRENKCGCKECQACMDVGCMKKRLGCQLYEGEPGKLCSMASYGIVE